MSTPSPFVVLLVWKFHSLVGDLLSASLAKCCGILGDGSKHTPITRPCCSWISQLNHLIFLSFSLIGETL